MGIVWNHTQSAISSAQGSESCQKHINRSSRRRFDILIKVIEWQKSNFLYRINSANLPFQVHSTTPLQHNLFYFPVIAIYSLIIRNNETVEIHHSSDFSITLTMQIN